MLNSRSIEFENSPVNKFLIEYALNHADDGHQILYTVPGDANIEFVRDDIVEALRKNYTFSKIEISVRSGRDIVRFGESIIYIIPININIIFSIFDLICMSGVEYYPQYILDYVDTLARPYTVVVSDKYEIKDSSTVVSITES